MPRPHLWTPYLSVLSDLPEPISAARGGVARVCHAPPTKALFRLFSSSQTLHQSLICKSRPKPSKTNPSRPRVYVTRRHGGGAFGEWVAPLESSAADLHASTNFGLIWLVVEPGTAFIWDGLGGLPSSGFWRRCRRTAAGNHGRDRRWWSRLSAEYPKKREREAERSEKKKREREAERSEKQRERERGWEVREERERIERGALGFSRMLLLFYIHACSSIPKLPLSIFRHISVMGKDFESF